MPEARTTAERNAYRNKQHEIYRQTTGVADHGVHVPHQLEGTGPGKELLKSYYLRANMQQLKVIKKQENLDPASYTNDKGYIFYAPSDPPLDR